MLVGKKGFYSLKVLLFFAFSRKESFSIRELSKRLGVSEKVLEPVLFVLRDNGFLSSKRGPQGGYKLIRDISEVTVKEIIYMTGQQVNIFSVENGSSNSLIDSVLIDLRDLLEEEMVMKLQDIKVKELIDNMKEKVVEKGLTYMI